jgi:nicotinate-nucleotide adenylyltransferase
MGLDRVDFLVANDPWQKSSDRVVSPAALRLEMVEALVGGQAGLGVDDREIRRGGLTYTVETLEELTKEQPDTEVFLIVGQDTANRIGTWHRHEEVLALSTLVIVNRVENNSQLPEVLSGARVHNVSMPLVDVSSTGIRAKVASGEDIASLTSDSVADLVRRHGLYGASA